MIAESLDPRGLIFVDECGTHTSLAPLYGYSPKGERLKLSVPRNRGKNTTLLASITLEGMGPSLAVEGSTTAEVFEAYLEHVLLPELQKGQVVLMDSLPAHKPKRVRELIERRGCQLLYLPGYSPDYNPIEEAFSKIKEILRRACARTREALGSKHSAKRYLRSASGMPGDSSSTPVTILRVNYYETCCWLLQSVSPRRSVVLD
jgi:transposase